MSIVLPESMNKLDTSKVRESFETIENYIRYINERIDYFTTITARQTTGEINAAVQDSADTIKINIEESIGAAIREMDNVVTNLQNSLKTEIDKVQGLLNDTNGVFQILDNNGVNTGWTITSQDGKRVIKASSGGIGISNDGGQTYQNAITGDGVIANSLIVGDSTLERYVSIEDGVIRLGNEQNGVSLKIESDAIAFYNQQGQILAKFTANGLEFERDSFQAIRMGNYTIRARSDGSIYFDLI